MKFNQAVIKQKARDVLNTELEVFKSYLNDLKDMPEDDIIDNIKDINKDLNKYLTESKEIASEALKDVNEKDRDSIFNEWVNEIDKMFADFNQWLYEDYLREALDAMNALHEG